MRLSVSTRIFLGFAVVIIAFGSACTYAIYRMNALRESVTLVWQEIVPVSASLRTLTRQVRVPEEFLALRRPSDAQWLQRILPRVEPFRAIEAIEGDLAQILESPALAEVDREAVRAVVDRFVRFRTGTQLADAISTVDLREVSGGASPPSDELFDQLVRRIVRLATEGKLTASSPEARATVRALRRINRELVAAARDIDAPIRAINDRATADEKAATLAVLLIAAGALVVSLLMLAMSQLTLAPIRQLRRGAQRIAAGDYDEVVRVRARNEIGDLADEFNRMAGALRERDEELARQREALLRADRLATIGKMAAQITHEIRNPLSSIGLNAEMLEEELSRVERAALEGGGRSAGDDPGAGAAGSDGVDRTGGGRGDAGEARSLLDAIQGEVQRLKAITEEYLRFARLPKPELVSVDVGALVGRFLVFLAKELEEADVAWTAEGAVSTDEGGPPPILADPDQLRQVLMNVARNAVDAVRELPAPRTLQLRVMGRADGGVDLFVRDNGAGIDPAIRERLFEPFVTGKQGGTGLGLALSHQIVEDHGGRIRVISPADARASSAGRPGTEFIIELPGG